MCRSCVWSEPSVVDAAAYEFADTAKYLEAGETTPWATADQHTAQVDGHADR